MGIFMVFIVVAIFLPEWLGITGKKAEEIMAHQISEEANLGSESAHVKKGSLLKPESKSKN